MGFWEIALGGGLLYLAKKTREISEEEKRRKATPCKFNDGISKGQFDDLVEKSARYLQNITDLSIDGPVVSATVRSHSGLSEWDFEIDYNDYGHITGRYWLSTENHDSSLPQKLADNISAMIKAFPEDVLKKDRDKKKNQRQFEKSNKQKNRKKRYNRSSRDIDQQKRAKVMLSIILIASIAWIVYFWITI